MTKIKNEYSTLNQWIDNKSDIIKIEDFTKQISFILLEKCDYKYLYISKIKK